MPPFDWRGQISINDAVLFWTISQACIRKEDTFRKGKLDRNKALNLSGKDLHIHIATSFFFVGKSILNKFYIKISLSWFLKKHSAACIILWLNSHSFKNPKTYPKQPWNTNAKNEIFLRIFGLHFKASKVTKAANVLSV